MKYRLNDPTCLPLDESVLLFLSTSSSVRYAAVAGEAWNVTGLEWQGSGSDPAVLE